MENEIKKEPLDFDKNCIKLSRNEVFNKIILSNNFYRNEDNTMHNTKEIPFLKSDYELIVYKEKEYINIYICDKYAIFYEFDKYVKKEKCTPLMIELIDYLDLIKKLRKNTLRGTHL